MEEFSFPGVGNEGDQRHHFSGLWFHSPQACGGIGWPPPSPAALSDEERMDMLWEDLNEDDEKSGGKTRRRSIGMHTPDDDEEQAATGCLPPAMVVAAVEGRRQLRGKQGLVAMLSMWKKLFLSKARKSKASTKVNQRV